MHIIKILILSKHSYADASLDVFTKWDIILEMFFWESNLYPAIKWHYRLLHLYISFNALHDSNVETFNSIYLSLLPIILHSIIEIKFQLFWSHIALKAKDMLKISNDIIKDWQDSHLNYVQMSNGVSTLKNSKYIPQMVFIALFSIICLIIS